MAYVLIDDNRLSEIAGAIRSKNGTSALMKPSEMSNAIRNIEASSGEEIVTEWAVGDAPYANAWWNSSMVVYKNELHVLGGTNSPANTRHYKWDGQTWTNVGSLPAEFSEGCAGIHGSASTEELHIMGGSYNNKLHYKWNGSSWTKLTDVPFVSIRSHAVTIASRLNVIGSSTSGMDSYRHYQWTGTGWGFIGFAPSDTNSAPSLLHNNELHLFGGNGVSNPYHYKWETGGTWTQLDSCPANFRDRIAFDFGEYIDFIGFPNGFNSWSTNLYNKVISYNWSTGVYTYKPCLLFPCMSTYSHSGATYNNKHYYIAHYTSSEQNGYFVEYGKHIYI